MSTERGRRAISALKYPLRIGLNGDFKLDTPGITPTGDYGLDERLKKSADHVASIMGNLFSGWMPFVTGAFLPPASVKYRIEDSGDEYRVFYKDGPSDVDLVIGKDLLVNSLTTKSPDFNIDIHPRFVKTAKGLLLNQVESSAVDARNNKIHVFD